MDGHATSSASGSGSAGESNVTSPISATSSDAAILQRLRKCGVPSEFLERSKKGVADYVKEHVRQLPEVIAALVPGPDEVQEVSFSGADEVRGSGTRMEFESHCRDALKWVQWAMFHGAPQAVLATAGQETGRKGGVCGAVLGSNDIAYRCRTCEQDSSCVFCVPCFQNSDHATHDCFMIRVTLGGYCDCGDVTAWKQSGFCFRHGSPEQVALLPSSLTEAATPVMEAFLLLWVKRLKVAEEVAGNGLKEWDDQSVHEKVACQLSVVCIEMLLEFCSFSGMLAFTADIVGDRNLELLDTLMRAECYLPKSCVNLLCKLLHKLLVDTNFEHIFAQIFISYYPFYLLDAIKDNTAGAGTSTRTKYCEHGIVSTFSKKIFVVPTLTLKLVTESGLLDMLLHTFKELFCACVGEDGRILVGKGPVLKRITDDIRYVMNHLEVSQYVAQRRSKLARALVHLLVFIQGMYPYRRMTSIHMEKEAEDAYSLEFQTRYFHHLFVAGAAASSNPDAPLKDDLMSNSQSCFQASLDSRNGGISSSRIVDAADSLPDSNPGAGGSEIDLELDVDRRDAVLAADSTDRTSTGLNLQQRGKIENGMVFIAGTRVPASLVSLIDECVLVLDQWLALDLSTKSMESGKLATDTSSIQGYRRSHRWRGRGDKGVRGSPSQTTGGQIRERLRSSRQVPFGSQGWLEAAEDQSVGTNARIRASDMDADMQVAREGLEIRAEKWWVESEGLASSTILGQLGEDIEWPAVEFDVSQQDVSFHIPLHRMLALLFQKALHLHSAEKEKFSGEDKTVSSDGERSFLEEILPPKYRMPGFAAFVMEHPLRLQVLYAQYQAGMWRCNSHAITKLYNLHHTLYWCDESVELDLFLLQCCSVLSPCENFVERILTRFSLSGFFNLSLWDPYEYQITLAQELLNFLIRLVSERGFSGLTEKEALRRELVQRLALKDATRSYLVDALPIRFQDSKHLEECLDAIAVYCKPSETQEGKYALREECWRELDLYYPRWNPKELQSAKKRYSTACGAPAVFLQLPCWSQPFAALQGLGRLITSSRIHDMLRSIFFHSAYTEGSSSMGPLQLHALHLLALALDACKFQNKSGVHPRADDHFSDLNSPLGFNNASSNNVEDHPALLLRCVERVGVRSADGIMMPEPQSMLSLLVLLWRKQVDEAGSYGFGDLIMKLLRRFAELDRGCMHEIESLAPEILHRVSVGTTLEAGGVGDINFKDDISISKSDKRRSIARERQAAAMNIEMAEGDALLKALISSKERIESCLLKAKNLNGCEDVFKDVCQTSYEIGQITFSAREAADGESPWVVTFDIKHSGSCSQVTSMTKASGDQSSTSKTLGDAVVQTIQTLHSLRSLSLRKINHGTRAWVPLYWLAVPWSNFTSLTNSPALPWIVLGAAVGFLHSTEQKFRVQPNRILSKKIHAIAHLETAYQLMLRELHACQGLLTEHAQFVKHSQCTLRLLRACIFLLYHVYDSGHLHTQAAEFARRYTAFECLEANPDRKIRRRFSIADCYMKARNFDKAAEAAREALTIADDQRIEGTSLKLYQVKAAAFLPPEEALSMLEHVLAWKERSRGGEGELSMESQEMQEGAVLALRYYITLGCFNEAVKLVQGFDAVAEKLKGDNGGGWESWQLSKAKLYFELGEHGKGIEIERDLEAEWVEGTDLSTSSLILVAHHLEMTNDNDSALEVLDECESICGGDLEAHGMSLPFCANASIYLIPHIYERRGNVYYKVGKYEEALRDLEKGVIMAKKIFGLDFARWRCEHRTLIVTNYLHQARCLIKMGRSEEAQARLNDSYEIDLEKYNMGLGYTELLINAHARNHEKVELEGRVHFLECAAIQSGLGRGMKAEWVSFLENTEMRSILWMIECSSYLNAETHKQPFWRPLVWAERSHMRLFMFEKKNCDFDRFDWDDEYAQSIVTQVAESCINLNTAIIAYSYNAMHHFHTYIVTKVIEDGNVGPTVTCSAKGTRLPVKLSCGCSWDLNLVTDAREAITTHLDPRPHLDLLYRLLVPDLPDRIDTLLFAPQGELSKVPFAALYDSRDDKFLVEKKCVGVIPSFRALQRCFDQQVLFEKNFTKLRPPFLAGNPKPMGRSMGPLPAAAEEAEAVAKLWPGVEPVVRERMTKAAVVDGLQTSSFVLVATHGDIIKDDPSDGILVMQASGGTSSDQQDSEILTGCEISDLDVRAGVVILSACKTGDGTVTREGMLGPGRAVLHAGAPTVIVTLWPVDDVGTKELVVDTIREFRQGEKTLNQCLQLAMQQMIKDGKSIYEWASLSVIGSPTLRWPLEGDKTQGLNIGELSTNSGGIHDVREGEGKIREESNNRLQLLRWITSGCVAPALEATHGPKSCFNHVI